MATNAAIAATSEAILGLLQSSVVGSEFDGVAFGHLQAADLETPVPEGVTLWLYRITVSGNRNLPPAVGRDGRRYKPALPLDLHYLVTAWAGNAVRQQRLLGFAIRVLEDTPILPSGVLNQHGPEADVFRPEETVELVFEALSVQDLGYVWDVAQSKEQPSAPYVARMVKIESTVPFAEDSRPVQTRALEFAKAEPR